LSLRSALRLLLCQRKIHRGQGQESELGLALAEVLEELVVGQVLGLQCRAIALTLLFFLLELHVVP
jgi:hypothetical protein